MPFLRTLGWVACVLYSTVPSFWLMVHPRAHRWRAREASPFRVLVPAWITMWIGVGALTGPWKVSHCIPHHGRGFPPDCSLPPASSFIRTLAHTSASPSWVACPKFRSGPAHRLVTSGIRARVRHPVYLGHLCEMLAWSLGTGLLVCWLLTAFAIVTGAVMIRMEDRSWRRDSGRSIWRTGRRCPQ